VKKLSFLVSLGSNQSDYPKAQALAAEQAAQRLGADIKIVYANDSAVDQSQQLLEAIQSPSSRPDAVVCHPVSVGGMEQVAAAAAGAGIGWAVLNRKVDYLAQLRQSHRVPVFGIRVDHEELGRIQAKQFERLLPQGGQILYLEGFWLNSSAKMVTTVMLSAKAANLKVLTLPGDWTEESGYQAAKGWLTLTTSHQTRVGLVAAQSDDMAVGARRAFQDCTNGTERDYWSKVPFTGCYACPGKGVREVLTASVMVPPHTDQAIEMFARYFQSGVQPPEETVVVPVSYPPLEKLAERRLSAKAARA